MNSLLLTIPLVLAAPVPKEFKKPKPDAEAIVGRWIIVVSKHHERDNPGGVGIQYEFQADGTCVIVHQDKSRHPVKYALNAKGTPKTYDWICTWGTWKGVYELNGDKLKVAGVRQGNGSAELPPAAQPGANVEYSELERVKE